MIILGKPFLPSGKILPSAFFLLVLTVAGSAAQAPGRGDLPRPLALHPIGGLEIPAAQFLHADAKGRLFVLCAQTLEVYPLTSSGLGEPEMLVPATAPPRMVLDASMGRSSGEWVLWAGQDRVHVFDDHKETPISGVGWLVTAVGFLDDLPAAWVVPAQMGNPTEVSFESPELLQLDDGAWETRVSEPIDWERYERLADSVDSSPLMTYKGLRGVWAARSSKRGLWIAYQYSYRIRHFSATGKVIDEITVGEPQVEVRDRTAEEVDEIIEGASKQGVTLKKSGLSSKLLVRVVEAITEGRDGRLYVLLTGEFAKKTLPKSAAGTLSVDFALDRFDPVRLVHERIILNVKNRSFGRYTMAAGRDGLFIVSYNGNRYWASWEELEGANWQTVPDVQLDGQPLFPVPLDFHQH